jgi:CRP-like cAMP-binding protein
MPGPTLRGIAILADLSADALRELERVCQWHRYDRGKQIFDRASLDRDVYFVVEGRVDIVDFSLTGREVSYASVAVGGFFGELAAIDGEPRSASVVAGAPSVIASLDAAQFRALLGRQPTVAMHVLERLARIIRSNNERIMDLATLGAVQRVHRELLRLGGSRSAGPVTVDPAPTQSEIARRAATTRETVARVVSTLRHSGLVRRKGRAMIIDDPAALGRSIERIARVLGPKSKPIN